MPLDHGGERDFKLFGSAPKLGVFDTILWRTPLGVRPLHALVSEALDARDLSSIPILRSLSERTAVCSSLS